MLVLLSPSKAMNFESTTLPHTSEPALTLHTQQLADLMREHSPERIAALMKLSDKLADLNHQRYQSFDEQPLKQAVLAFSGDTYKDIPLADYTEEDFMQAQARVRILSGLYGVLRPLDLIHPYRLEMGTRLETERGKNLYEFWGDEITQALNATLEDAGFECVVNCASTEYFKAVRPDKLGARIITPIFKDEKKGVFKVVSFYAKRARGMMADFIVRERLEKPEELREFCTAGYAYDAEASTPDAPVFLRAERPA